MVDIFNDKNNVFLITIAVIAVGCGVIMGWIRDQKIGDYDNLCFVPLIIGFIFVFIFAHYHNKVIDEKYGKIKKE